MKVNKLISVSFEYEDGTVDAILDPRACLLFQSRCNSNGILSGIEEYIITTEKAEVNA